MLETGTLMNWDTAILPYWLNGLHFISNHIAAMLLHYLSSIDTTMNTALLNSHNACLLLQGGHATHDLIHIVIPSLYKILTHDLNNIPNRSFKQLVISGIFFLTQSFLQNIIFNLSNAMCPGNKRLNDSRFFGFFYY